MSSRERRRNAGKCVMPLARFDLPPVEHDADPRPPDVAQSGQRSTDGAAGARTAFQARFEHRCPRRRVTRRKSAKTPGRARRAGVAGFVQATRSGARSTARPLVEVVRGQKGHPPHSTLPGAAGTVDRKGTWRLGIAPSIRPVPKRVRTTGHCGDTLKWRRRTRKADLQAHGLQVERAVRKPSRPTS